MSGVKIESDKVARGKTFTSKSQYVNYAGSLSYGYANVLPSIYQSNLHSASLGRKKAPPLASIWARSLDASAHGNTSA